MRPMGYNLARTNMKTQLIKIYTILLVTSMMTFASCTKIDTGENNGQAPLVEVTRLIYSYPQSNPNHIKKIIAVR